MAITENSIKTIFNESNGQFFIEDNIDYLSEFPADGESNQTVLFGAISVNGSLFGSPLLPGENVVVSGGSGFTGVFVGYGIDSRGYFYKTSANDPLGSENIVGQTSGGGFTVGMSPVVLSHNNNAKISMSIDIDGESFYSGSISIENFDTNIASGISSYQNYVYLPLDSSGEILEGVYDVTYTYQIDVFDNINNEFKSVTSAIPTKTFTFSNSLSTLKACLSSESNCYAPFVQATDRTPYDVAGILPSSISRSITLTYPSGSNVSPLIVTDNTTTNLLTNYTNTVWSGLNQFLLESDLTYDFTNYIHKKIISVTATESVDCSSLCEIFACIKSLKSQVDSAKGKNQFNYTRLKDEYDSIIILVKHHEAAISCGDYVEAEKIMTEIKSNLDCSCVSDCGGNKTKRVYGIGISSTGALSVEDSGVVHANIDNVITGKGLSTSNHDGRNIQINADVDQEDLNGVDAKADAAQLDATSALSNAGVALMNAAAAQSDATSALMNAAAAQSSADAAQLDATSALSNAGVALMNAAAAQSSADTNSINMGDKSSLNTEDKTSLVNAINELHGEFIFKQLKYTINQSDLTSLGNGGAVDLGLLVQENRIVSLLGAELFIPDGVTFTLGAGVFRLGVITDIYGVLPGPALYPDAPLILDDNNNNVGIYAPASYSFEKKGVRVSIPAQSGGGKLFLISNSIGSFEASINRDIWINVFYVESNTVD